MLEVRIAEQTVALVGDRGVIATWEQQDAYEAELHRSHDDAIALVAVDECVTAISLADGHIAAQGGTTFPLDAHWTFALEGEIGFDRGHTGFQGGSVGFAFELGTDPAVIEAESAKLRAELGAAARTLARRRFALRHGAREIVVHDATVAPSDGGEVLLWPPIAGPTGVLLRHAFVTDDGRHSDEAPQRPWLVRPDGAVVQLPFELGVSPLLALPGDRWLLPGYDTVWRDDYDEPLCVLDAAGETDPWLVRGEPVTPSRILREVAPELIAPVDPGDDVPWEVIAARRVDGELRLAVRVDEHPTLIVGTDPMRLLARSEDGAAAVP